MAVEVPLIGHKSFSFHIRAEELHSFKDGTLCLYLIQRFHLIKNTFDSSLEYDFFRGLLIGSIRFYPKHKIRCSERKTNVRCSMAARNLFKSGKVLVPRTQLSFEDGSLYVYLQLKYLLFLRLLAYEMGNLILITRCHC